MPTARPAQADLREQDARRPNGAAAFFDVDNTIMRGASIFHMARGLYARDFFTARDIAGFAYQQIRFQMFGENMGSVSDVQSRALSFIRGHSVAELRALGEEIYDDLMATKIWPGTHAMVKRHLAMGQPVWLVTATPIEIADVIAERLGLTGALGTVAEHIDGVYTGRLIGKPMHGDAKAEAVRSLAEKESLDLTLCSAYSDSINDLPMLTAVGHPFAINPDAALSHHARVHGWPVRDFRTARKAAKVGLPVAASAAAGAVATAIAVNRRRTI